MSVKLTDYRIANSLVYAKYMNTYNILAQQVNLYTMITLKTTNMSTKHDTYDKQSNTLHYLYDPAPIFLTDPQWLVAQYPQSS